jgi:hypothetical protein
MGTSGEAVWATFSSLILDDSCCNLVTTVVILMKGKRKRDQRF